MSFMGPTMLEIGVCGVVWVAIDSILTFLTFWVKQAIVDCILRAVVVMEGAGEFNGVMDGVGNKKNGEIL